MKQIAYPTSYYEIQKPVQRQLLFPLIIAFSLVASLVVALLVIQQRESLREIGESLLLEANDKLDLAISQQSETLLAIEKIIIKDPQLRRALINKDHEFLLSLYQEEFEYLKSNLDITHFYFHDASLINILRLHQISRSGDVINRATALNAQVSGLPSTGLELGVMGTFTLRAIHPVFSDGILIGYIELGTEIEDLSRNVVEDELHEWMVILNKSQVDRNEWQEGMSLLGRENNWDQFGQVVLSTSSISDIPVDWRIAINEASHSGLSVEVLSETEQGFWRMANVNLFDIKDENIGQLLIFYNITEFQNATVRFILTSIFLMVFLISLLLSYLYFSLRKVDHKIKSNQLALQHLANNDVLTGLANRKLLQDRLDHALSIGKRQDVSVAIMFMDLDHFKDINDSYGHTIGDELLIAVTKRLKKIIREGDTFARNGGDEFVFILEHLESAQYVSRVAHKIIQSFEQPFCLSNGEISTSISVGISIYPQDGDNKEILLRNADSAMYKAKGNGRNKFVFYDLKLTEDIQYRVSLKNNLRYALKNNELVLHYQPQFDLHSGKVVGVEGLARWTHSMLGNIPPSEFIPLAEQSGLIHDLGKWSLTELCRQGRQWIDKGLEFGKLSVNLSCLQFQGKELYETITRIIDETGFPADRLAIEVTETSLMENMDQAIQLLTRLKALGVTLAIDDFGTGYSSLSYLKKLPIDLLKIDRCFIKDIPNNKDDVAIVNTIISLSKNMGLDIIAEGVETRDQIEFLQKTSCQTVQGNYYSEAISAEKIEKIITSIKPPLRATPLV